jgi:hypothetical protein
MHAYDLALVKYGAQRTATKLATRDINSISEVHCDNSLTTWSIEQQVIVFQVAMSHTDRIV